MLRGRGRLRGSGGWLRGVEPGLGLLVAVLEDVPAQTTLLLLLYNAVQHLQHALLLRGQVLVLAVHQRVPGLALHQTVRGLGLGVEAGLALRTAPHAGQHGALGRRHLGHAALLLGGRGRALGRGRSRALGPLEPRLGLGLGPLLADRADGGRDLGLERHRGGGGDE